MSGDDLTPEAHKQQHAESIAKADTFEAQGVSRQAVVEYLKTDEGALYWWRVAEAAAPGTPSSAIDRRAIDQLQSGRELPRMETLNTGEPLVKIVPAGTPPSAYSPYFQGKVIFPAGWHLERAPGKSSYDRLHPPDLADQRRSIA